jgi:Ca2+:H+ antiporter
MPRPRLSWLLVFVPVSLVGEYVLHNELLTFLTAAAAILPLAGLIGRATDQLAMHAGPRIGGLLNATFGNVAELIIAIFLLLKGTEEALDIVKASLVGSIIGNLLLVLGASFLVGGIRYKEQSFNAQAAGVHASSLTLAVIGLLMPALFVQLTPDVQAFAERETVSVVVAVILMAMYGAALAFTLITHQHLFRTPSEEEHPRWSLRQGVGVLVGATAFVALMSEVLVGALEPALDELGLSPFFVGLILVPIIGNAAEHSAAILFAWRNKLDVSLEIAIGSSTQIALFVAPALVFISLITGNAMDFIFNPFEIAAVALSVLIVDLISRDGATNWLEGAQLLGAYVIMAISFFFVQAL